MNKLAILLHMLTIALIDPKIPQNTGNIARLCAAWNCVLHLVGNLGFKLTDKHLKRAGLDYWPFVKVEQFLNTKEYISKLNPNKIHLLTTKSKTPYTKSSFKKNDTLLFGSETEGLSEEIRDQFSKQCITIPMPNNNIRSLNLSTSVGIVLSEAYRQISVI